MLKDTNVHQPQCVLIDFGVSKAMAAAGEGARGTPGYMPPETFETQRWYPRGDVFSMGVCFFQLLTDKLPPTGARSIYTPGGIFIEGCATIPEIVRATCTRVPPWQLLPAETTGLNKILPNMLSKNMQGRPTAPRVLLEPWFTGNDNGTNSQEKQAIKGKSNRATMGITRSFLATMDFSDDEADDDDGYSAFAAMKELHNINKDPDVVAARQAATNYPAAYPTPVRTAPPRR